MGVWTRLVLVALAAGLAAWCGLTLLDDGRERALAGQMTQLRRDATVFAALFAETASRVGPPDERGRNRRVIDAGRAALLFGRVEAAGVRLRLFDASGRLVADSGTEAEVEVEPLSPIQQAYDDFARWLRSGEDGDLGSAGAAIIAHFPEARGALEGETGERVEQAADETITLIAAVPVWRDDAVIGALVAASAAPVGIGDGLGSPQRLAAAFAVALVVLGLGALLFLQFSWKKLDGLDMDIVEARQNMVDCQLRTNKVTDAALLSAMGDLPREAFLPVDLQAFAYSDGELNIAEGRSMLAPMTAARMLQCLELKKGDVFLLAGPRRRTSEPRPRRG